MSHFYGVLQGNRGEVSRTAGKSGQLRTVAASWQGCVRVSLWHNPETGKDMVTVYKAPWHGAGIQKTLYEGPVGVEE